MCHYSFKILLIVIVLTICCVSVPEVSFAARHSALGSSLCSISGWFTGNLGKGLALIGVGIVGIGAMLGKVSWGLAVTVGVGIAALFGADAILIAMGQINCRSTFTP